MRLGPKSLIGLGMPGAIRFLTKSGQVAYDLDALALFTRFTTPPTFARKAAINALIVALKTAGIWSKLDTFYVLAAADSQAARCNWITNLYNLTAVASPTFLADRYYLGNGTTSYLNSGFNPTTAPSPKFTQDSATLFHWSLTDLANGGTNSADIGSGNSRIGRSTAAAGQVVGRPNNGVTLNPLMLNAYPGLVAWSRSASNVWEAYANGVDIVNGTGGIGSGGGTEVSSAPTNDPFMICAVGNGGFVTTYGVNQEAIAGWGSNLTAGEHAALKVACQAYLQNVGAI